MWCLPACPDICIARRVQPSLTLVNNDVGVCVCTMYSLSIAVCLVRNAMREKKTLPGLARDLCKAAPETTACYHVPEDHQSARNLILNPFSVISPPPHLYLPMQSPARVGGASVSAESSGDERLLGAATGEPIWPSSTPDQPSPIQPRSVRSPKPYHGGEGERQPRSRSLHEILFVLVLCFVDLWQKYLEV